MKLGIILCFTHGIVDRACFRTIYSVVLCSVFLLIYIVVLSQKEVAD